MLTQGLLRRASCSPALQESELFRDLAQSSVQLLHFPSLLRSSNSDHADSAAGLQSVGTLSPAATWDLLSVSKQVVIKISARYVRNDFWPGACSQTLRMRAKERKRNAGSVWDTVSVVDKTEEIHRSPFSAAPWL